MYKTNVQNDDGAEGQVNLNQQSKVIMLVDDDPIFRRITGAFLAAQGYEVVEAEDGLDGLRKLQEAQPDLILCDLSMPVLNGIEFVEEVSMEYPSMPLIVVSATQDMSEVAKALRFGIKDFLPKPINDHQHLSCSIESTLEATENAMASHRDFSSQWFRVDGEGELPEERELHWHLDYLHKNPNAAKELLHALLPDNDTAQGAWHCSYRLLQSTETMPLVFDYVWLLNGQMAFYIVDSSSNDESGVGTTLLVRALFHDYLRNLRRNSVDLKDMAAILERGIKCSECAGPVTALFGLADFNDGSLSILPAGLDSQWSNEVKKHHIAGNVCLGNNCLKNFVTNDLSITKGCKVAIHNTGASSFTFDIYTNQDLYEI
ncbi:MULTISPECIES: response regulator [Vibrio]|uniref:Response regulator n=2 Tax=Vibrio TaxID=662 RepID=A0A7X4RUN6_9VIBR|nr:MULTISPECIES: response regulator [Vibrio]MBF8999877.1 response regulator [Vibrio nitrifigilis]MZI93460.1 response regulator [Vibrio eleionomae]